MDLEREWRDFLRGLMRELLLGGCRQFKWQGDVRRKNSRRPRLTVSARVPLLIASSTRSSNLGESETGLVFSVSPVSSDGGAAAPIGRACPSRLERRWSYLPYTVILA